MKTNQKKKMKTKKIELLIVVFVTILLFISFAKFFQLTGFDVIVATVVEQETQQTLTGTVLTPAPAVTTTVQVPRDSNPPTVNLTAPVKYLELDELVPLDCQAADDTKVRFTTIKITSPSGSVSNFVSEYSSNNLSFRVTEVGNYSFICTAEDTSNNAANSVRYLLPVVNKVVQQTPTQTSSGAVASTAETKLTPQAPQNQTVKTVTTPAPEKNLTTSETVNETATTTTEEPLLIRLIKRFFAFFSRPE